MSHAKTLFCGVLLLALAATPPPLAAQADNTAILEEIIVTARKRDDLLQEIPLAVSTFSADQMERRNFHDLQDISQETAGLVYENFATAGLSTAAVIRGMGQTFTTSRIQNTAAFLDGIYLQRQSMVNPGLMDLARIEVIKGPQNSQFGRNAFSGVVHYISRQPTDEISGDVTFTYGDGDRLDVRGAIAGPLVANKIYGRFAVGLSEFDGHSDNDHPFAKDGPGGDSGTNDLLGGWDDEFLSATLTLTPSEQWEISASYYRTESVREPQAFYDLNGARYAYDTSEFGPPPRFPFLAPLGANCLNTVTFSSRQPFPAAGPHAYCGKLPGTPPVLDDPKLQQAQYGDTRGAIAVDPRSLAMDSESSIARLQVGVDISETLSLDYQLGYVNHEASGFGTASGRASLVGSSLAHLPVRVTPFPPFIEALGPPGSFGALANASIFNANPNEALEATSHELRLTWTGENLAVRFGAYRADSEDEDGGTFYFLPPCNSSASCGMPVPEAPNPLAGTYLAVVQVVPGRFHIGIPHVYDSGHGVQGDQGLYEDKVTSLFGDLEWDISDTLSLALEGRYTWEKKSFEQFSSTFGAAIPDTVDTSDSETFTFFTPRAILKWTPNDGSMFYGLVARGAKTGGFNAVDPSLNPGQATFKEEENTTFELGAKNQLFDDRLTLNAALFLIDWKNVQGTEAAASPDAWTTDVVGNIGDAEVIGLEIDGVWLAHDNFFIDYRLGYNDAEYKDATYLSSVAGPNSSWGCDDTVCRADGRVDGNQVERTAKLQYGLGLNYRRSVGKGWQLGARLDFNHRSRMYATPLNLAHNGGRTLSNANIHLSDGHWHFTLWSRNVFDKKYVANSFVLPSFTRYIVGLGARRTFGLTLKYSL